MSDVLEVTRLTVARGGFDIVRNVDLCAGAGEITVLLGANGAGKTTLLEGVSRVLPSTSGMVRIGGRDVTRLSRVGRARAGLAHVEQGRAVFGGLTVDENLLTTAPRSQHGAAFEHFPSLADRRRVRASHLSGGEQQMLVLARALLTRPRVMLLDEISLGLAPRIVQHLMPVVVSLANDGIAIVLVEQYARLALEIGDKAVVLQRGAVVFDGSCEQLRQQPELLSSAYLARSV